MDETVFSDYLIFKEEIKMDFKSFIKKTLLTALTLAVCIPVILKVASVNASAEAYVDVEIQYLNAAGEVITSASPGDQVTINVIATPVYADGTVVSSSEITMLEFDVWTLSIDGPALDENNRSATFTVPDPSYKNIIFDMNNEYATVRKTTMVSGQEQVDYLSAEFRGDMSKELIVSPLSEAPDSDCNDPSGDGSNGDSDANDNPGSSSGGSSSSSDSAPAAGGGAAAPAGGGAAGNAGSSTVGGVYTATSMNNVAVTSPAATVAAAIGLSEADVAAGTNVRTYICDSRNREMKDALKAVAETSGRNIVAYIDIDLYTITKAGVVTNVRNTAAPVTITFGLPGSLANAGHTYSILCLNPDGTPAIFEDIDTNNATVTINATAFGTYAIMINP